MLVDPLARAAHGTPVVLVVGGLVVAVVALGATEPPRGRVGQSPGTQTGVPQEPPATGLILGRVIDADSGQPLAGAVVSAPLPSLPPAPGSPAPRAEPVRVLTTTSGYFVFRDLPQGAYNLTASLPGYAAGAYGRVRPDGPTRPVMLREGERRTDVEIRLWRLAVIVGRVVDETGEPAVGVSVRAVRRTRLGPRTTWTPGQTSVTDDRGVYRLGDLTPGDYLVAVPSTSTSVPVQNADAYRQAMNEGRSSEAIRERMESRAPIPSMGGIRLGTDVLQLMDATGSRGLAPPQPQPGQPILLYRTAFHPSAASAREAAVITVRSGEVRDGIDIAMQLVPTARVSGAVIGPDGPAAGIGVHLTPADVDPFTSAVSPLGGAALETATTSTDAEGRFSLLGVPAGAYVVSVLRVPRPQLSPGTTSITTTVGGMTVISSTGSTSGPPPPPAGPTLWARMPVSVAGDDIDGVRLELRTGMRLQGEVVLDGTSLVAADRLTALTIRLLPPDGSATTTIPLTRPDSAGRFEVPGHPPGRYTLQVTGSPGPGWGLKSVTIAGRDVTGDVFDLEGEMGPVVITMTDRPSGLAGTVQGGANPRAIETATVVLIPADVRTWVEAGMPPGRTRTAGTMADGRYMFASVLPGEYLVAALPGEVAVDFQDPDFVAAVARVATRVVIAEGTQAAQALPLSVIR